jgi:hypothetical protein
MNRALLPGLLCLCLASAAVGGPEHLIKQRAKDVAGQNNERQGAPPTQPAPAPGQPAPAVAPPPKPVGPALSAQAAAIRDALAAVAKDGDLTAENSKTLLQSLTTAARGSAKPSTSAMEKLTQDLGKAVAPLELKTPALSRLAFQLDNLLRGSVAAKEMDAASTAIHDQLREAGAGRVEAKVVANDLKAILVEMQRAGLK